MKRLDELNAKALLGGGEDRIKKQHDSGKLTARERVDLLPTIPDIATIIERLARIFTDAVENRHFCVRESTALLIRPCNCQVLLTPTSHFQHPSFHADHARTSPHLLW